MSRFADATRTKVVSLGPCACPGTPHERDEAICHAELGYGARVEARRFGAQPDGTINVQVAQLRVLELFVISWNLLGADGLPVEPSLESIGALDPGTIDILDAALLGVIDRQVIPKASAGRSGSGTPANGSRTPRPTTRTPSTSTSS